MGSELEEPAESGPSLDPRLARSTSTPKGASLTSLKSRPGNGDRPRKGGGESLRTRGKSTRSRWSRCQSRSRWSLSRSRSRSWLRSSLKCGRSRKSSRSRPPSRLSSRHWRPLPPPRPLTPRKSPANPPPRGPLGGSSKALGPRGGCIPESESRNPSRPN